jgi:hypothetical protein
MITCSRSRLSSSSRSTSASAVAPKVPASEQSLWRIVQRVCKLAGVRVLSPDQLRLALPTASCGRAVATSARFGRCLITRV